MHLERSSIFLVSSGMANSGAIKNRMVIKTRRSIRHDNCVPLLFITFSGSKEVGYFKSLEELSCLFEVSQNKKFQFWCVGSTGNGLRRTPCRVLIIKQEVGNKGHTHGRGGTKTRWRPDTSQGASISRSNREGATEHRES